VRVLVVNAGSSSLKLRVLDDDAILRSEDLEPEDLDALQAFCRSVGGIEAAGHRVVHGGPRFTDPVLIDSDVCEALAQLTPLAPLQQPAALAGIRAVGRAFPGVPAVACFDTSFHATLPAAASTYPLPREWRERFGLRRYGFHGLSHSYAARRGSALATPAPRRVVTCHLGSGSSLAAVVDGTCVDTTMGFTPNEGIPMATRSGSVDVGMLTWLLGAGLSVDELTDGLQQRSGIAGLTGSVDMRLVTERAGAGDPDARLAVDVWLHRLTQAVASMAASARGLDLLVFTGGIGERAAGLRQQAVERLAWLGLSIDPARNEATSESDAVISPPGAAVTVAVVQAREDVEIARGARAALHR
jgi:acetate kinase